MNPKVSFVVPCYRLAHLLPDCVTSILSQNFGEFELLIMDDCSPDGTPEVAASFKDSRIKHIRNNCNLGHLRNYNKGISLSQGQYVWLISADDMLRTSYVLKSFVQFMDSHSEAGFVFCPGVGLENGKETGLLGYAYHGDCDRLFRSEEFFLRLLRSNSVLAASGMVRRKIYDELGMFPMNMPFAGDWYLWLLFALHHDVGYVAEPMVGYRRHAQSMTTILNDTNPRTCTHDDLLVLWEIKRRAEEIGRHDLARRVDRHFVERSAMFLTSRRASDSRPWFTFEDFEQSIEVNAISRRERQGIRSQVYARVADDLFWKGEVSSAGKLYRRSVKINPWSFRVLVQCALLSIGTPGIRLRQAQLSVRKKLLHYRKTQARQASA